MAQAEKKRAKKTDKQNVLQEGATLGVDKKNRGKLRKTRTTVEMVPEGLGSHTGALTHAGQSIPKTSPAAG